MKNSFENISPENYSKSSVIAREAAIQMISRLDLMSLQPKIIIDVGCGVAESSELLKKRYPEAEVLAVDSAFHFLRYAQKKQINKIHLLCADAYQLPVKEYSVDFIFANFLLPWCDDLNALLALWQRLLKPNGLLMFTLLGPDTLREVNDKVDLHFLDMHNVGDALVQSGFADPVLDVERVTLTYQDAKQLGDELRAGGFLSSDLSANLKSLTYEIVYGHGFGTGMKTGFSADESGEVRVPISALRAR